MSYVYVKLKMELQIYVSIIFLHAVEMSSHRFVNF